MPFLLLLLLAFACMPKTWPMPFDLLSPGTPGDPWLFAGLTWAGVLTSLVAAARIARHAAARLYLRPAQRESTLHRYARARGRHLAGTYLFFALAVFGLGWGWTVQTLCELPGPLDARDRSHPILMPAAELFVLAPLLVCLVGSWALFYDADRAIVETGPLDPTPAPIWSRWSYVGFHARQNLALVSAPVVVLVLDKSLRRLFPSPEIDWLFECLSLALLGIVFACLPWILRIALGLRPLGNGPLRERLLATAQRLDFRFTDILVWDTRGGIANAMVAGILPRLRYVLLTDRLIAELAPDEVEAVFGHEVGHVRHHHMFYYLGFMLLSLTVVAGLWDTATRQAPREFQNWLHAHGDLQVLPLVALVGAYIFVVFGFLSRRCERQADIFGCRAVSCQRALCVGHLPDASLSPRGQHLCSTGIRTFIAALEKVAILNGISRSRPGWLQSWQHSTIARRVEFLQRLLADPSLEPRFQRTVCFVKWGLFLGLCAILLALGTTQGWDVVRPV